MVKLRPHHLLCLRFFEGKGYSEEFTENTYAVLERLKTEDAVIVKGADDLCSACPKLKDNVCEDGNEEIDERALQEYKVVNYGDVKKFSEFLLPFTKEQFVRICQSCMWKEICLK